MNPRRGGFRFVEQFRQTKVEHFHLTCGSDHHVARLDVAMNDALRVRNGERIGHLNGDQQCAFEFERSAVDKLSDVLAVDVLHRDEVHAVHDVQIKDRADVRMIQRRSEPCLAFKAFQVGFLRGEFRR